MRKGFLWNRLNSPAAAIISSLIRMMTKLVPDIKPDKGGERPSVYLFSQLMALEAAVLSPYVPRSLCRTLVAHSEALGVHATARRGPGCRSVQKSAPFSGMCQRSTSARLAGPLLVTSAGGSWLKNADPSLAAPHRCAHCWGHGEQHPRTDRNGHRYLCICWGSTSLMWLLGATAVPVTAKVDNRFLGEAKDGTSPLFLDQETEPDRRIMES